MPRAPYRDLARFYDLVYGDKDYRGEADRLHRLAERLRRSPGRRWVDVACGTGEHLRFLRRWYAVEGVERAAPMRAIAQEKLPGVPIRTGDMRTFRLGEPADVVSCLFSAIGYLEDEAALAQCFRAFARALRPGGLAVVEPWISPDRFRPGFLGARLIERPGLAIARLNTTTRSGDHCRVDLHYLIGRPEGYRYRVEKHRLRLTAPDRLVELLGAAGFRAWFEPRGLPTGRGLLLGIRNGEVEGRRTA